MIKHADSHIDHGLTNMQLGYILQLFADRNEPFIETIELPELGTVPCGLYGPLVGDPPVDDAQMLRRTGRKYNSRCIRAEMRPSKLVTVIAGAHDGHPCVLFTAFGGPLAPREVDDPTCPPELREASIEFWAVHALAVEKFEIPL